MGPGPFVCVLKFDSPLPEDHRVNTTPPFRQPTVSATTENLAEAPPRSPTPVSTGGRSGVGKSSDGHNEHSRIVLPQEIGEKPSLSSGLSDMPWINSRRPGFLYSIIEYEKSSSSPPPLLLLSSSMRHNAHSSLTTKHAHSLHEWNLSYFMQTSKFFYKVKNLCFLDKGE